MRTARSGRLGRQRIINGDHVAPAASDPSSRSACARSLRRCTFYSTEPTPAGQVTQVQNSCRKKMMMPSLLSLSPPSRILAAEKTFVRRSTTSEGTPVARAGRSRPSKRLSAQPGKDLVGPPDPTSNLRPVIYGSAFEKFRHGHGEDSGDALASSSRILVASSSVAQPPPFQSLSSSPYSTSEFTSAASAAPSSSSSSSSLSSNVRRPSAYYSSLLDRLEVAELEHHLRRSRSDRFSQSFWADNNRRYKEALEKYQSDIVPLSNLRDRTSPSTPATSASSPTADVVPPPKSSAYLSKATNPKQDLLAPFYAAWLSANSARHEAYNRQLWQMTREDLGPALRYATLKRYVSIVRWWNTHVWPRHGS